MFREWKSSQCVSHLGHTGTGFFRFPKETLVVIILTNLGNGYDFLKDKGANMSENGLNSLKKL